MFARSLLAALLGVATLLPALAVADGTETTVTHDEPVYDELQQLLDESGREAMNAGKYRRAWYFFWRLLEIDPEDTRALRESGRVAQALGRFSYAVDTFARVDLLRGAMPDPELHFLRGEALHALGRKAEAEAEWVEAELELAAAPPIDRRGTMWLARIAALRGDLTASLALYATVTRDDNAQDAEVALSEVEAYILSHDWRGAEIRLRAFLKAQPDHARGLAMLAWVLDARGQVDEALVLRAVFADEWTEHPRKTLEYARALERVHAYGPALARYREARELGVDDVSADIARLEDQLSPELAAGASLRGDPSGSILGWMVGGTLPLGGQHRIAVTAVRESSSGGLAMREATSTSVTAWGIWTARRGGGLAVGPTVSQGEHDTAVGASAVGATSPERRVQLQVRADYGLPWRESSSTIREGGVVDVASAQLYATPWTRRLLVSASVQGRRLGLAAMAGDDTHAYQLFGALGVDYLLTSDPGRVARGQVLDAEMLAPRSLVTSTVVSLRHYELDSDNPFGQRLVLVEHSRIDEVSATVRQVLDAKGILGGELRGGAGYDWTREVRLFRAGASVMLSPTRSSRLSFDYDVASETGTGLAGRRHAGSVVFHVDL